MALHVRQQILDAATTALTGLASTGANVFQGRVYPLEDTELPGLLVYWDGETSSLATIHGPGVMQRDLQLVVEVVAKSLSGLDAAMNQVCKEVEIALSGPPAGLLAMAQTVILTDSTPDRRGNAERPAGSVKMTFAVEYFTQQNAPDVAR